VYGRKLLIGLLIASALFVPTEHAAARHEGRGTQRAAGALILRYTFDNDSGGVVRDASPNALHGSLVNADPSTAYVASVPGRGRALSLVGSKHQYVSVPERSVLDTDRFTVAAIVRYTGVENDGTNGRWEVLEKANAYWLNIRTDGRVRVGGFFGSCTSSGAWKFLDSAQPIPTSTWTHVAGTYNGSTLKVWINGVLSASRSVAGRTCSNNEPLAIGAKNLPSKGLLEAFWDGQLDEVRIYNRALYASEIKNLVPA
jgi:hypothetical protein